MILRILTQLLDLRVPVWLLILSVGVSVWYATRPPTIQTQIEYRDRWEPKPPPKLFHLTPSVITLYKPYPVDRLRVDTVYVPSSMDKYYLTQPNFVYRQRDGVRIDAFNPETLQFESWNYTLKPRNISAFIGVTAYRDLSNTNTYLGVRSSVRARNFEVFGQGGINPWETGDWRAEVGAAVGWGRVW